MKRPPRSKTQRITVEMQWEAVDAYSRHSYIQGKASRENATLRPNRKPYDVRGAELQKLGETPFVVLMKFFCDCQTPPDELVWVVIDLWRIYLAGAGSVSLEDAFMGRAAPKAGPYALRALRQWRKGMLEYEFINALRKGRSRTEAAEIAANAFNSGLDADSVKRMLQGVTADSDDGSALDYARLHPEEEE